MLQEVARSHNTEHFKCGKVFNTNEKRCTPGSVYPKRIYAAWGTPFLPLFLKKLLMHMKYLLMCTFFMLMLCSVLFSMFSGDSLPSLEALPKLPKWNQHTPSIQTPEMFTTLAAERKLEAESTIVLSYSESDTDVKPVLILEQRIKIEEEENFSKNKWLLRNQIITINDSSDSNCENVKANVKADEPLDLTLLKKVDSR